MHPGPGRPVDEADAGKLIGEVRQRRLLTPELQFEHETDTGHAPLRPAVNFGTGGEPAFSVDKFAENLRQRLDGNCVGWAFVINMNGQEARSDQDGTAITPGDQDDTGETIGTRDMTPDTRVNIASVSKTITAVAVLRLLRANNLGTLTPISAGYGQPAELAQERFKSELTVGRRENRGVSFGTLGCIQN